MSEDWMESSDRLVLGPIMKVYWISGLSADGTSGPAAVRLIRSDGFVLRSLSFCLKFSA